MDVRNLLESLFRWFHVLGDGVLCGFASVGPTEVATEFKLHKLYIHPDWQRQGLGSALLQECESTARARGATKLLLNVSVGF